MKRTKGVGQVCRGCNETLYGVGWVNWRLVIFSNCICHGNVPSFRFLRDVIRDLIRTKAKVTETPRVTATVP